MDYYDGKSLLEARNVPPKFYDVIIGNIANFATIKSKDCDLEINYIITQKNYAYLWEISEKLKLLGVNNIRFSPMWCDNFHDYHSYIKEDVFYILEHIKELETNNFKIYSSYHQVNDEFVNRRRYKKCYINQTVPVVGADQNIYVCHNQAYSDDSIIGSIKDKSFKEVWFSKETKDYLDKFDCQSICTDQCAADKKNQFINDLLETSRDNFV